MSRYDGVLNRIKSAIESARSVLLASAGRDDRAEYKAGLDPVTEPIKPLIAALRKNCCVKGKVGCRKRVWTISRARQKACMGRGSLTDTRFVAGIPEFCVSIAFVENGRPSRAGSVIRRRMKCSSVRWNRE